LRYRRGIPWAEKPKGPRWGGVFVIRKAEVRLGWLL